MVGVETAMRVERFVTFSVFGVYSYSVCYVEFCVVCLVCSGVGQNNEKKLNVEQAVQLLIQLEGAQADLSITCI